MTLHHLRRLVRACVVVASCALVVACGDDAAGPAADAGAPVDGALPGDAGPAVVRTRTPVGRLRAEGNEIVDAEGHPVALRGVNLGSWLFVETWMDTLDYPAPGRLVVEAERLGATLGADVRLAVTGTGAPGDESREAYYARVRAALPAGADAGAFDAAVTAALACADVADDSDVPLRAALAARFGTDGRDRVLDAYADAWITETDLDAIAERGLNLVRVPTTWRGWVADETSLDPIVLREATVTRIEALLDACEARGLRAVIDLQESPGGHNTYSGPARLYEDPASQTATIELWRAIAARLRARDSVAAYSLLAEPFGAPDVPTMVAMYDRLYDALRADGDTHLLVIHDGFKGVDQLPTPAEQGWTNVVYSSHYFEFGATSTSAVDFASRVGETQVEHLRARGDVPFFVGSFSSIHDEPWAYDAFDLLTERYSRDGWSWSLWAWKRIDDPLERELFGTTTAWGVWRDFAAATPAPRVDICHDDEATILTKLSALRTENLAPNATLDAHLRAAVALP